MRAPFARSQTIKCILAAVALGTVAVALGPGCSSCAIPTAPDAGRPVDAYTLVDAGALVDTGGPIDAGAQDAGHIGDGAVGLDGGLDDTGTQDGGILDASAEDGNGGPVDGATPEGDRIDAGGTDTSYCNVRAYRRGECECGWIYPTDAGCPAIEAEIETMLEQGRSCVTRADCEWVEFHYNTWNPQRLLTNDCKLYVNWQTDACAWRSVETQWMWSNDYTCYQDPYCNFAAGPEAACIDGRCVVCPGAPYGSCANGECAIFTGVCNPADAG